MHAWMNEYLNSLNRLPNGAAGLPPKLWRQSGSSSGGALYLSSNISALHSSTRPQYLIYALIGGGPLLRRRGHRNWLGCFVALSRVLSEMHISLKKACTDFISKFICVWQHQRPKTKPQIPGKVLFSYYVPFKISCHHTHKVSYVHSPVPWPTLKLLELMINGW